MTGFIIDGGDRCAEIGMAEEEAGEPTTYVELVHATTERLRDAGVPDAAIETRLLIQHALCIGHEQLLSRMPNALPENALDTLAEPLRRRLDREPLAHITGHCEFYGRSFRVNSRVLIPRPETELLVDQAKAFAEHTGLTRPHIVDIGVGSGALAITLALELPGATVSGTDVSAEALTIARNNAAALAPDASISFLEGDLGEPLEGRFDIVVSNPPYIRTEALDTLAPEIAHEPLLALDGGPDGMAVLRRLIQQLPSLLKPERSAAYIEFDPPVAAVCAEMARAALPGAAVNVLTDLAGLERCLSIELP